MASINMTPSLTLKRIVETDKPNTLDFKSESKEAQQSIKLYTPDDVLAKTSSCNWSAAALTSIVGGVFSTWDGLIAGMQEPSNSILSFMAKPLLVTVKSGYAGLSSVAWVGVLSSIASLTCNQVIKGLIKYDQYKQSNEGARQVKMYTATEVESKAKKAHLISSTALSIIALYATQDLTFSSLSGGKAHLLGDVLVEMIKVGTIFMLMAPYSAASLTFLKTDLEIEPNKDKKNEVLTKALEL